MEVIFFLILLLRLVVGSEAILNDQLLGATLEGDVKEILSLVRRGANPNIMLALQTPLLAVCNAGNIEAAKELIRLGADPNFGEACYPLLVAIESHNLELVKVLIESGCSSLNHSATLLAVNNGPFEIVKLLVDHFGFDLNHQEIPLQVERLLIESSQRGVATIFEYILKCIPDSLIQMELKWTVYQMCFHWFKEDIWAIFVASGWLKNLVNSLGEPVLLNMLNINLNYHASILIRDGVNVNHCDNYGNRALHVIKSEEHVENLLRAGADLEVVNHKGQTPLISALERQRRDAATALLKHGANPNAIDNIGCKPLILSMPTVSFMKDHASLFMTILHHPRLDLDSIAQEAIDCVFALSDTGLRDIVFASTIKEELNFRRSFVLLVCGSRFDQQCNINTTTLPSEIISIVLQYLSQLNRSDL